MRCLGEHLLQPSETVGPACFMQGSASLCSETAVDQENLGPVISILKGQRDYRLSIVRVGRGPSKRVRQTGGRIDLPELSREVEEIAFRRLHRDPIAAADERIEINAGSAKASRPPPLNELGRIGQGSVYDRPRERQKPLQAQHQSIVYLRLTSPGLFRPLAKPHWR
jgi:hypothetical protein